MTPIGDRPATAMEQAEMAHSVVAKRACAAGAGMFAAFLVGMVCFYVVFGPTLSGRGSRSDLVNFLLIVWVMILPIPVHLILMLIGVISLFAKGKKLYPILAVVINAVWALCSLAPWVLAGLPLK